MIMCYDVCQLGAVSAPKTAPKVLQNPTGAEQDGLIAVPI